MRQRTGHVRAAEERKANVEDAQEEEVVVEGGALLQVVVWMLGEQHGDVLVDKEEQNEGHGPHCPDQGTCRAPQVHKPRPRGLGGLELGRHRQRLDRHREEVRNDGEGDDRECHCEVCDRVADLAVEETGLVEASQRECGVQHRHCHDKLHRRVVLLMLDGEFVDNVANAERNKNHRYEEAEHVLRETRAVSDRCTAICDRYDDHVSAHEDANPRLDRVVGKAHALADLVQLRNEDRDRPCRSQYHQRLTRKYCEDHAADALRDQVLDDAALAAGMLVKVSPECDPRRQASEEHVKSRGEGLDSTPETINPIGRVPWPPPLDVVSDTACESPRPIEPVVL
mmetsp:Transcript_95180/g.268974  ORF Transcript_95180/g.268974 Transcript_95180/m.268974 type:complete len:340 (-) Transcript_95180:172-1191(-)